MRYSKTEILAGLQCEKQLFLRVHHPELAVQQSTPDSVTGQVVQAHARLQFPDAVLVRRGAPGMDPFAKSAELIADTSVNTIFEAGIQSQELAVFVDVLQRNGQAWDLIEIKATTDVKDKHIEDVSVQAVAVAQAGIPIRRFWLMHINNEFVYHGNHDYTGLLIREDISARVLSHMPFIESKLVPLQAVVTGQQPERHLGSQYNKPYPCPYRPYCETQAPDYPVADLPNGWQIIQTLHAKEIFDIRDIPAGMLTSDTHQRVRRITIAGVPELLPGAGEIFTTLPYPRYYLDFVCIQFAIPIWEGTRPYMQLPFQWSCHIERDPDTLLHREFLDTSGVDPRRAFAEALLAMCGESGPIIVYNQSFEKRIIRELAEVFPELCVALLALNERVFDLLPVVKANYYHPAMKDSWSIKCVLPCLVPELSYKDLAGVQDGTEAQAAYLAIINTNTPVSDKQQLINNLLAYCKLNTYAMVKVSARLAGK